MDKTIAFFDAKPYDRWSFERVNEDFSFDITYFETSLNTSDLIDALRERRIGSAGLDVYEEEEKYFF